jgi:hypothetical protein
VLQEEMAVATVARWLSPVVAANRLFSLAFASSHYGLSLKPEEEIAGRIPQHHNHQLESGAD